MSERDLDFGVFLFGLSVKNSYMSQYESISGRHSVTEGGRRLYRDLVKKKRLASLRSTTSTFPAKTIHRLTVT